ncbi:M1 family aminopeptidase [Gracilimonas tropica]|uniref:M1 family aminopeptidase n=1 Tax=Gracilimonas tropica TaxID=454600 RepID=UPI000360C0EC|nr:M1 family aminopeptidase [Gracilimonas tropica]
MMLASLLKFEIIYQRKLWALPVAMTLFFLTGFQIGGQGFAPDMINFNAPYQISYYTSVFTLGSVFAIMFFVINGILRDSTYRMQEIMFSTGIQKHHFFFSRFGGVFFFSLLSVSMLLPGMMAGTMIVDMDPERLAPFSTFPYFWNWLVFVLPNVLICTGFIFSIGLLTKNRMSIYTSAVLIYVLYFISSFYFNSPVLADSTPTHTDNMMLAALADPFGISAFMEQSQYLTPLQKNKVLVSLSGNFLLNRLLWISITAAILGGAYRLFSFRTLNRKNQKPDSTNEPLNDANPVETAYLPLSPSSNSGNKAFWQSFLSQSKIGINQLFKSLPFQVMIVLMAVIMGSEFYSTLVEGGSYSESLYPVTAILAELNTTAIFIFGVLLIIFFSGEWGWKERTENMYLILDATPASNASFFWSKVSVLICIPLLLITLEILIAITFQFIMDHPEIDVSRYLSLFYYQGTPLLFYLLVALFIQGLSPDKYIGMGLTGLVVAVFGTSLAGNLGIEHPLLRIGAMPPVVFSDMAGVSNNASSFNLLSTHWLLLGLILSLIGQHVWQRGITDGFFIQIKRVFKEWSSYHLTAVIVLGLAFFTTSGMIFYKTNIESEYISSEEMLNRWADYEKQYKHYAQEEWLYPVAITTDLALYPEQRSYAVDAIYTLENKSDTSVHRSLIIEKKKISNIQLERATLVNIDSTLGIYEFQFDTPVLPGQSVDLTFSATNDGKGLFSGNDIVKNGSYIHLRDFSPYFGYSESLEIQDNDERRKRGLPKRTIDKPSEADFELMESGFGRVDFETTLSVPDGQTGISVGNLQEMWTEKDRNYYRYKTPYPVAPIITYHSADYETVQESYKGISLEQYYHSGHGFNNTTVMNSMKQTLDYMQNEFGPYPLDHLRITELPSFWGFGGFAAAGTISMVEDNLYLVDERDPKAFNLVAKRTIHEVAHQWWGHQLGTQSISGGQIFVEGFAKYTEGVVMEKYYGMPSLFQLGKSANHTYFTGRSYASTPEQPLYLEQGEHYMLYGKSYMVMMALKDLIGENAINDILKTLVKKHKHEVDATVTTLEFLTELYAGTSEEHHALIDDWFKEIITYDLSVEDIGYVKLQEGGYEITIRVKALKFESVDGMDHPTEMDEPVTIGVFTAHPSEATRKQVLSLDSQTIISGEQEITVKVDSLPKYISIDPYGTRPDLVRSDNHFHIE